MSILTDNLEYYSDLLAIQYRMKTRAIDTIRLLANQSFCDGLIQEEQVCFDLDTALGVQLDIVGRIVGVPRKVVGLDLEHTWFEMTNYAESIPGVGMIRYVDTLDPLKAFRRYIINSIYTMTDPEMRNVIRIKILTNNSFSSFKNIKEGLYAIFAGGIDVTEEITGSIITLVFTVEEIYRVVMEVADFLSILPKPMGVNSRIDYV